MQEIPRKNVKLGTTTKRGSIIGRQRGRGGGEKVNAGHLQKVRGVTVTALYSLREYGTSVVNSYRKFSGYSL